MQSCEMVLETSFKMFSNLEMTLSWICSSKSNVHMKCIWSVCFLLLCSNRRKLLNLAVQPQANDVLLKSRVICRGAFLTCRLASRAQAHCAAQTCTLLLCRKRRLVFLNFLKWSNLHLHFLPFWRKNQKYQYVVRC